MLAPRILNCRTKDWLHARGNEEKCADANFVEVVVFCCDSSNKEGLTRLRQGRMKGIRRFKKI